MLCKVDADWLSWPSVCFTTAFAIVIIVLAKEPILVAMSMKCQQAGMPE